MSDVSFAQRLAGLSRVLAIFVVLALLAAVFLVFNRSTSDKTVTVDFPQAISLYEGSDVRILGVPVGTVQELEARGDRVRATISYDADIDLPADVKAMVVSPAIVGDRFVQMAPAYTSGAVLADGAEIGIENTAVPVELDEIYASLNDLSVALGPDGANRDGALSSLVSDTAAQLDGQGAQLNETIRNFGRLSTTLADNSDDLFGSIREVSEFVALLERNDQVVRAFNDSTAGVADLLADERDDLAATLATLSDALIDVESLVRDNRGTLRENVVNLRVVAETLANREAEFEEITVAAPTALVNVALAYNGVYGTLDTHVNLPLSITELLGDPAQLLCGLLGENSEGDGPCATILGLLDLLPIDALLPRVATANTPLDSDPAARSVAEMLAVTP
ncbi:virulence factor Mce family protein [Aeromicrobium marinum DSM 15272]|uniref:Virulence factor Mce family protein n=1 Tax=Aeromicrobium marinum DSM 15272 TaxID=585531 RepID=E2SGB0_9ACTN|nr:MCE family protein [Aeromicrobium marinum]EFQ81867.1 virulence factor Mce family protein [Aeromicrobium marinum DSM 15272]